MAGSRWNARRGALAVAAVVAVASVGATAPATAAGSVDASHGFGVAGANAPAATEVAVDDLAGVVAFQPPVGSAAPRTSSFDASLLPHLTVTVSLLRDGSELTVLEELTAPGLALKRGRYQATWKAGARYTGEAVVILVKVADLPGGQAEFEVAGKRAVPIRFTVGDHPRTRTAALHAEGLSASEVADALVKEFAVTASEATLLLAEDTFPATDIGEALNEVFGLTAAPAAQLLRNDAGASAAEIAEVLTQVFGLAEDPEAVAQLLEDLGFGMSAIADALRSEFGLDSADVIAILRAIGFIAEDLFGLEARELAVRFSPQLRFDQAAGTFPMSAEEYFLGTVQGSAGRQENTDSSTLQSAADQPPTYYRAYMVGNQVRVLYWWFYGYQEACFADPTNHYHHGDWERVMVTLKEDRSAVAAVTYWQHTGWYTRLADGADLQPSLGADYGPGLSFTGEHPIVYAGKIQHGSYHDQGGIGDSRTGLSYCWYFADWRNNNNASHLRMDTGDNLVSLSELGDQWMVEESLSAGMDDPEILGEGDGSTAAFDLRSVRVDPTSLRVSLDGARVSEFALSEGTEPGDVDQIVLSTPPDSGVVVSAAYRSASFKWGPNGTNSDNNIGTHPVRASSPDNVIELKACEGYDATEFGVARGCFASQCQYRNGQNLYTEFHPGVCSRCPAGYTDMGEFCGKGAWWKPWEWSTRSVQKYDLDYTVPSGDQGLCTG